MTNFPLINVIHICISIVSSQTSERLEQVSRSFSVRLVQVQKQTQATFGRSKTLNGSNRYVESMNSKKINEVREEKIDPISLGFQ